MLLLPTATLHAPATPFASKGRLMLCTCASIDPEPFSGEDFIVYGGNHDGRTTWENRDVARAPGVVADIAAVERVSSGRLHACQIEEALAAFDGRQRRARNSWLRL